MQKIEGSLLVFSVDEPVRKALEWAMHEMHASGFVHGDVHPQNVLVVGFQLGWKVSFWQGTPRN